MSPNQDRNLKQTNAVELRDVSVDFGDTRVLKKVCVSATQGEIVTILGKSGSGKTTILKSILGLIQPSSGTIHLRGVDVTGISPEDRRIGMVFQDVALFPHLTVFQNISFPAIMQQNRGHLFNAARFLFSRPPAPIRERAQDTLKLVHLEHHSDRRPSQLSGGEQQRVAIARALITSPDLLCLDEPFASLDKPLRDELLIELREINKRLNSTIVYVTHDSSEAMSLSDRIAILHDGRILEHDDPQSLYKSPRTALSARLLGQCNIFKVGEPASRSGRNSVVTQNGTRFAISRDSVARTPYVGIYPSDLSIVDRTTEHTLSGVVTARSFLGSQNTLSIKLDTPDVIRVTLRTDSHSKQPRNQERVSLAYDPERVHLLDEPLGLDQTN